MCCNLKNLDFISLIIVKIERRNVSHITHEKMLCQKQCTLRQWEALLCNITYGHVYTFVLSEIYPK